MAWPASTARRGCGSTASSRGTTCGTSPRPTWATPRNGRDLRPQQGRPQPDGQELTDPALIEPGWILRLPPAGPGRRPGPARPPRPRPGSPPRPATVPATASSAARPARGGPPAANRDGHTGTGRQPPVGWPRRAGLAAAVAAAAVIAGVHRRRRYRPGKAVTSRLDPAGPPVPPAIAALRRAAAPAPGAATVRPDDVDAYFTGQDPGPDDTRAACPRLRPGPPRRRPDAGTTADPASPRGAAPPGGPQPPGVIALGVRGGSEVCADIAALGGLGLTGPGAAAAARAILAGLLARAVPGQPGGPAEVIMTAADAAVLFPGPTATTSAGRASPA